jgi:hypothetical protein
MERVAAMRTFEIRADYNSDSIIVYQAFRKEIALPAVQQNRFVPPFSLNRMTWIKPSFLWLMARSNWGLKAGQEHVLAIRITRPGWEEALSHAVLTSPHMGVYRDADDWRAQFERALVHVQWDPERSIHGKSLPYRSIQVGLSRQVVAHYVNQWTLEIRDCTPLVRRLHDLIAEGHASKAQELLPKEQVYPVDPAIARRLGMA